MKRICTIIASVFLLVSCEKNIDFDLKNADDVLVVDAQIENGQVPNVILTKSFDFFSRITPDILFNSFVRNAEVTISNGTLIHKMKEYSIPLGGGYSFNYYSIDSANLATAFVGQFNKQYTLTIKAEGKEYTAKTSIPLLNKFPDSIWFKPAPLNPDSNARVLATITSDPPGLGNYIRYFTKKNSENFLPGENSVFDDAVIDGTSYELLVDPGIDRNNRVPRDSNFFKRGDTVTVKLCNIDKPTYTFWSSWEFAQQSIGNPFAQPNKVVGNISNGALGAFYGYAAWYKTIIAK
jgi:Domain of unknown function (DUF4249)